MNAEEIASIIINEKPNLPSEEILERISFKWNDKNKSAWDGGYDVNEDLREKVIEILNEELEKKNPEYVNILRFLLQEEIRNCDLGEMSTSGLSFCYDRLADLKFYEDIPLLLSANNETSFDANCALYKDRLFYNGYENVMKFLKSNNDIDDDIIESIQYYAEFFGYDKDDDKI